MRKDLKAADVMQRDVVTVGPAETVREAMSQMIENRVSGLAVLDHNDHCVGVVSAADILALEYEQAQRADEEVEERVGSYFNFEAQQWENMRVGGVVDQLPELKVREVMSRSLISVPPQAPLDAVAELMIEKHVHRVLVVDDKCFLHGLISALDFVRLFVGDAVPTASTRLPGHRRPAKVKAGASSTRGLTSKRAKVGKGGKR
jgi:CBS-domain-containing membrane protein